MNPTFKTGDRITITEPDRRRWPRFKAWLLGRSMPMRVVPYRIEETFRHFPVPPMPPVVNIRSGKVPPHPLPASPAPRGFMQAAGKRQVGTPIKPSDVFEFTVDPDQPPREETYRLNSDKSVAVATDYYTNPDMSQCPRGVKLILIGKGGVGTIAIYDGDPFWIEWAPMPKRSTGSSTG